MTERDEVCATDASAEIAKSKPILSTILANSILPVY